MITIGLTGSIGMGKSTVAAMFRAAGVPVFDADAEVHKLQGPRGALVAAIESLFPGSTSPTGVDRLALGRAVFGHKAALTRLEQLIYPAINAARGRFLRRHRARAMVVLDVPLLFEKGGWRGVDAIVVVSAAPSIQRRRVLARRTMTPQRFHQILALQTPDLEKRRRADFVVDTGTTRLATRTAVRRLIACLAAHGGRYRPHARNRLRHRNHRPLS